MEIFNHVGGDALGQIVVRVAGIHHQWGLLPDVLRDGEFAIMMTEKYAQVGEILQKLVKFSKLLDKVIKF